MDTLLEWLKEAKLTRSAASGGRAGRRRTGERTRRPRPAEAKDERWHRFQAAQRDVSAKLLSKKVGRRLPVIIDEAGPTVAKGRSKYDAPEIDGTVHVASRRPVRSGDIVTVKVERRLRPARRRGLITGSRIPDPLPADISRADPMDPATLPRREGVASEPPVSMARQASSTTKLSNPAPRRRAPSRTRRNRLRDRRRTRGGCRPADSPRGLSASGLGIASTNPE